MSEFSISENDDVFIVLRSEICNFSKIVNGDFKHIILAISFMAIYLNLKRLGIILKRRPQGGGSKENVRT